VSFASQSLAVTANVSAADSNNEFSIFRFELMCDAIDYRQLVLRFIFVIAEYTTLELKAHSETCVGFIAMNALLAKANGNSNCVEQNMF
ncbi:hypothetical protein Lal_00019688, partial [Lupinus albus]